MSSRANAEGARQLDRSGEPGCTVHRPVYDDRSSDGGDQAEGQRDAR